MKYEDQFRIKSAWERRKERGETLKKGDKVVMHTCGEAAHYDGKIWAVTHDEFFQSENALVFLEGFSGSFAACYLQKVNVDNGGNTQILKSTVLEMIRSGEIIITTPEIVKEAVSNAMNCQDLYVEIGDFHENRYSNEREFSEIQESDIDDVAKEVIDYFQEP